MTVRIYVPATLTSLATYAEGGGVGPAPVRARAVTAWLREAWPEADEEEWEYAALVEAVEAATLVLPSLDERRVVAAADVEPSWVSGNGAGDSLAAVEVSQPVPLARVVSFHVDETPGDDGMADLLWYDATELDEVLGLL